MKNENENENENEILKEVEGEKLRGACKTICKLWIERKREEIRKHKDIKKTDHD